MNVMLYRRKVLLALIDIFGGAIDKLFLQKMLFLLSQRQEKPVYEFIPYNYGGYSFTAQWDIMDCVPELCCRKMSIRLLLSKNRIA